MPVRRFGRANHGGRCCTTANMCKICQRACGSAGAKHRHLGVDSVYGSDAGGRNKTVANRQSMVKVMAICVVHVFFFCHPCHYRGQHVIRPDQTLPAESARLPTDARLHINCLGVPGSFCWVRQSGRCKDVFSFVWLPSYCGE